MPEEKPRTWVPFLVAVTVAVLAVVTLIVLNAFSADVAPAKLAAAEACEEAYERTFPDGPDVTAGEVFSAAQWRDYNEKLVALGYLTREQADAVPGEEASARDDASAVLVANGEDQMTVIWQRDDRTHAWCVANTRGDSVVLPVTKVGTFLDGSLADPTPE